VIDDVLIFHRTRPVPVVIMAGANQAPYTRSRSTISQGRRPGGAHDGVAAAFAQIPTNGSATSTPGHRTTTKII
jgi:hypothetical protein